MQREDRISIAILAIAAILLFSPFLFSWPTPLIYPRSSLGTDLPREVWPLAYFVKESLQTNGQLPLWRPYLLSGAPLVGHPVSPLFYPPHWILLALPIALALSIDTALHVFWMSLGVYAYLRLQTHTRWEAAAVGAVIFSQAPMWLAHISGGHLPMISAVAWWPWIWLGCTRFMSTGRGRWAALTGVGLSAQLLNHGAFAALSILAIAAMSVGSLASRPRGSPRRLLVGWMVALAIAFCLSAIQLGPFLELAYRSTRTAITFEEASFGSLPPALLLTALFPPDLKFPEWFLYPGSGAIAFAAYGLATGWSTREKRAALAVLAGMILALGASTPLFRVMYTVIPGYSLLRVPARWWTFSLFALALLAAWGFEKWLARAEPLGRRRIRLLAMLGVLYAVASLFSILERDLFPFDVLPSAAGTILLLLILLGPANKWRQALIVLIVLASLWWVAATLLRPQPESAISGSTPIVSLLRDAAGAGERSFAPYGGIEVSDMARFGLLAADGYDPFAIDAYSRLGRLASGCDYQGYSASVPPAASNPSARRACPQFTPQMQLLALLNVRYVLLPDEVPFREGTFISTHAGLSAYKIPPGFGRAFGITEEVVVPQEQCFEVLLQTDLATHAVVQQHFPSVSIGKPPIVVSRREVPNGEEFVVTAADPGMLVRSETWAPGWKAYIDGQPTPVHTLDCALQGVWLEQGTHDVVFHYSPDSYIAGRLVTSATCGFLLLAALLVVYAHHKGDERASNA